MGNLLTTKELAKYLKLTKETIQGNVPFVESFVEFKKNVPNAEFVSFPDRGHFNDSTFPEIVANIKNIV